MAGMLPAYPVFDTDDDISSLPQRWEEWVGGLEDLMSSLAVADHERKWSRLRFYGGDKLHKLETQLQYDKHVPFGEDPAADPPVPGGQDHYRRLKEALIAHFAPCVNEVYARFRFRSTNQDEGESVVSLVYALMQRNVTFIWTNTTVKFGIKSCLVVARASFVEKH